MLNPALLIRLHHLSAMIRVRQPVKRRFSLLGHLVQIQRLKLLAISLIDVRALDIIEQPQLKFQHCAILYQNQVRFRDLKSIFRYIAEVGQSGLDSLVSLLFGVLLGLRKRRRTVKNAQRLEPLLEDFPIIRRQLQGVPSQVEHLDVFEGFELSAGLAEVAKLVEGHVEAEKVGEVARNYAKHGGLEHVIGDTEVDERGQGLSERLDSFDEVAGEVELAKVGR